MPYDCALARAYISASSRGDLVAYLAASAPFAAAPRFSSKKAMSARPNRPDRWSGDTQGCGRVRPGISMLEMKRFTPSSSCFKPADAGTPQSLA